jgi:hypothetical protein
MAPLSDAVLIGSWLVTDTQKINITVTVSAANAASAAVSRTITQYPSAH